MNDNFFNWWSELLRWLITTLVFGFYIALTFFSFRGDWTFLGDFEYYTATLSATSVAWFLRWIWAVKGLEIALGKSQDIHDKQLGKENLVREINQNNLTDLLDLAIKKENKQTKLKEYKNKCERKRNKYKKSKLPFSKNRYKHWKQERINCDKEEFDVNVVKVRYYKYDIDSMLSSTYRPNHDTETRGNINLELFKSFRISIITMIVFAVLGAINIWLKDYSNDDLIILGGKLLMFLINMYSGHDLGKKFVLSKYSNDLTKDYAFMKKVLKES